MACRVVLTSAAKIDGSGYAFARVRVPRRDHPHASIRSRASSSMVEQWTFNPLVQGSSPWGRTKTPRSDAIFALAWVFLVVCVARSPCGESNPHERRAPGQP